MFKLYSKVLGKRREKQKKTHLAEHDTQKADEQGLRFISKGEDPIVE
jgi:hypothetical protein